jgi:hypothetical protein
MPTKLNPNQSRQERCAQIGISVQCLKNWERGGVNIWDDDEVRKKISRLRNIPPTMKPEWIPQTAPAGVEPIDGSIDGLVAELHACTDKHQAQTIKTKIDGLINAYKLREAAGKYVAKSMVEESLIRIGATFKAALMRLEADLPPMMEGMDPPKMKQTIRDKIDEVLRTLEDEYAKAYAEPDS